MTLALVDSSEPPKGRYTVIDRLADAAIAMYKHGTFFIHFTMLAVEVYGSPVSRDVKLSVQRRLSEVRERIEEQDYQCNLVDSHYDPGCPPLSVEEAKSVLPGGRGRKSVGLEFVRNDAPDENPIFSARSQRNFKSGVNKIVVETDRNVKAITRGVISRQQVQENLTLTGDKDAPFTARMIRVGADGRRYSVLLSDIEQPRIRALGRGQ
jgi:hypothetical protein